MEMNFCDNLKNLCLASGLSQIQLANELGVTKQCISNWENDNVLPSIEMLVKISDFFSVPTDNLLERTVKNTLVLDGLTPEECGHIRNIVMDLKK